MAFNIFRKKDKPAPPAETQSEPGPEQLPDPDLGSEVADEVHEEPLSFQEVQEDEVSEADLPQGLATEPADGGEAFDTAVPTVPAPRKRTRRAHTSGPRAKGKRAARTPRSGKAARARPPRKTATARKTTPRKAKARATTSRSRKKK